MAASALGRVLKVHLDRASPLLHIGQLVLDLLRGDAVVGLQMRLHRLRSSKPVLRPLAHQRVGLSGPRLHSRGVHVAHEFGLDVAVLPSALQERAELEGVELPDRLVQPDLSKRTVAGLLAVQVHTALRSHLVILRRLPDPQQSVVRGIAQALFERRADGVQCGKLSLSGRPLHRHLLAGRNIGQRLNKLLLEQVFTEVQVIRLVACVVRQPSQCLVEVLLRMLLVPLVATVLEQSLLEQVVIAPHVSHLGADHRRQG